MKEAHTLLALYWVELQHDLFAPCFGEQLRFELPSVYQVEASSSHDEGSSSKRAETAAHLMLADSQLSFMFSENWKIVKNL